MSQRDKTLKYPEKIILCPACKEHVIWIPFDDVLRCSCCGHKTLEFEGAKAETFIRFDVLIRDLNLAFKLAGESTFPIIKLLESLYKSKTVEKLEMPVDHWDSHKRM